MDLRQAAKFKGIAPRTFTRKYVDKGLIQVLVFNSSGFGQYIFRGTTKGIRR